MTIPHEWFELFLWLASIIIYAKAHSRRTNCETSFTVFPCRIFVFFFLSLFQFCCCAAQQQGNRWHGVRRVAFMHTMAHSISSSTISTISSLSILQLNKLFYDLYANWRLYISILCAFHLCVPLAPNVTSNTRSKVLYRRNFNAIKLYMYLLLYSTCNIQRIFVSFLY